MQVTINGNSHEVPFDLSIITLGQFIEYQEKYGSELDKQLIALTEKKYSGKADDVEIEKTIDLDKHLDNEAIAWYSFWTGYDLNEARNQPFITPLLHQYRLFRMLIKSQADETKVFPQVIHWNDEQWKIADYKIHANDEMTFNEIVTAKELMRQMHKLGKGRWDALPYLCAIYFRKVGEPFTDELTTEDGERMLLLNSLPMNYAMQVAFFLNICVHFWSKPLAFSANQEEAVSLN